MTTPPPIRIGFVVHVMQVAGAEILIREIIHQLGERIAPTILCLDAIGALGEQLQAEGIDVVCLQRRPGRDLRVAWRLAREVRRRNIQIVHAHQYTPFFYAALARLLCLGSMKLILTEHGRHYPDVVSRGRRLANRLILRRLATDVNAVSAFSARSLEQVDGFAAGRVHVIENGIELEKYGNPVDRAGLRQRLGLSQDRCYLAHVARFHPVKDQATLLRAFAQVTASRPDVELLLAGDGPLRGELEELTRTLKLADRVHFLGVRHDVQDLLAAADIFVLTSVSEAASLTLLEAMASRLPVVVTNVGGNPEMVRDKVEGLLAPRGDVRAIGSAILYLLDHPAEARAMGEAGLARVRKHYRIERTVDRYFSLYGQLADLGHA